MIVDTSAIVALVRDEPSADKIAQALALPGNHVMNAATRTELGIVTQAELSESAVNELLNALGISVVPHTPELAIAAGDAYRRFGRGNHPAKLNYGDTFAYALAAERNEPILCVGDDFSQTDIATVP